MPNWCEGKLKVRGKLEDIKRFLNEGINLYLPERKGVRTNDKGEVVAVRDEYVKAEKDPVEYTDWEIIGAKQLSNRECYVEDTMRAFVFYQPEYWLYEYNVDDQYGLILDFKQAWAIRPEELLEIAKKYSLDMKIFGIECGMEFAQDIVIVDGELKKNDSIRYDDWFWDCPDPWCGG